MLNNVYCDTCVFLDLLEKTPDRHGPCAQLVDDAKAGNIKIHISAMVIAECFKLNDGGTPEEQSQKILDHFENDYYEVWQVDREIAENAHRLASKHGIMPVDAVHVATALLAECDTFYTYDGVKARGGMGRRKQLLPYDGRIGSPPLRIIVPPPREVLYAPAK